LVWSDPTADLKLIIDGKRYYWVEVMEKYNPPALRILITSKDYSEKLSEYNPKKPDGPWWYSEEDRKHYWNNNYCIEFMIEENLFLADCGEVSFVDHHATFCNINYRTCLDKGLGKDRAASFLFSRLAAEDSDIEYFNLGEDRNGVIIPNRYLRSAYAWIVLTLTKDFTAIGSVSTGDDIADSLVRSIMLFFGIRDFERSKKLAQLFKNEAELRVTIAKTLSRTFKIPDYRSFEIY
jgi:hypothetical protein